MVTLLTIGISSTSICRLAFFAWKLGLVGTAPYISQKSRVRTFSSEKNLIEIESCSRWFSHLALATPCVEMLVNLAYRVFIISFNFGHNIDLRSPLDLVRLFAVFPALRAWPATSSWGMLYFWNIRKYFWKFDENRGQSYLGELNKADWNQHSAARRVAFYCDDFFHSQHGGYYV